MKKLENAGGDLDPQSGYPNGGDWWEQMERWTPTRRVEFFKRCLDKRSVVGFGFEVDQTIPESLVDLGVARGIADWHGDLALVLGRKKTRYCLRITQESEMASKTFSLLVDFAGNGEVVRAATQTSREQNSDVPLCGWSPSGCEGLLDFVEGKITKVGDYSGPANWSDVEGLIAALLSTIEAALATGFGSRTR